MNKHFVITVAGTSSRFSKSIGQDVLKCIYRDKGREETILDCLLNLAGREFKSIVIVGGFHFPELERYIGLRKDERISLIYNDRFGDLGSNYSLYLGLKKSLEDVSCDEIVFAEGDLIVDADAFCRITRSSRDVLTTNNELIDATKAVAFYINMQSEIKYIYDINHLSLTIPEPFAVIANSGQVWKFRQLARLRAILCEQTELDHRGTNLNIIGRYFTNLDADTFEIIRFGTWHNCNTVEDYRRGFHGNKNE